LLENFLRQIPARAPFVKQRHFKKSIVILSGAQALRRQSKDSHFFPSQNAAWKKR
jgi:hypothetical protein